MKKTCSSHCIWQSMKSPHLWKAVTFSLSCHQDKFLYIYWTWQVSNLFLAWISWVVTCCAYRTGPELAEVSLSGSDGVNKEPQNTHRVASRHSLTNLHSHLRSCHRCRLRQSLCVCCCAFVCGVGTQPLANSTLPRPSCSSVRPQRADMKLDTTARGWQRRLQQLCEPHTPLPPLLFSSSPPALSLIMPSLRVSAQQHKHGYIGLYPVLHLRLCTFLHHVLMDNLTCPKKKHAWGYVQSSKEETLLLPSIIYTRQLDDCITLY